MANFIKDVTTDDVKRVLYEILSPKDAKSMFSQYNLTYTKSNVGDRPRDTVISYLFNKRLIRRDSANDYHSDSPDYDYESEYSYIPTPAWQYYLEQSYKKDNPHLKLSDIRKLRKITMDRHDEDYSRSNELLRKKSKSTKPKRKPVKCSCKKK
jgi:hypothetical protein